MISYTSQNVSFLFAIFLVISTAFVDAHLRGVDDQATQTLASHTRSGDNVRTNGQPAKSRAEQRNNAQFHRDAKNTRGMDFIGRVSDDVRNRELGTRIVGGTAADGGEFKFFASWDVGCGGSLIAPNMILTAAHCADQSNGSVRIGSNSYGSGGVTRRVKNQCMHPKYDESISAYDFMILTLESPVDTTKFPVIKLNNDKSLPKTDAMLTVIGFGATKEGGSQSNTLLKVDVPANSHKLCLSQYNWVKEAVHLCAGYTGGGKDSCQGDSGGPIFEMINGVPVQVGVVSTGDGCARPNKSGVYSRLSGGYDWIQQTMKKLDSGNLSGCNGGSGGDVPAPAPTDGRPAPTVDIPIAASPTAETPTAPTPTAETPTAPTPTAPTAETPTAPTAPTPTAPTAPTPTAPTAPTPTAPTAETPTVPTAPTPTAPTAETPTVPTAPTAPTPTAPTADTPTAPTADTPTMDSPTADDDNNTDDGNDDDGNDDGNDDDGHNGWWSRRVLGSAVGW